MTSWAYLALYGWAFAAVPALFVLVPIRTAVFVGVVFGWLFLPFGKVDLPGPLELTKFGACTLPVMACIAVFDMNRLARFRASLLDLPMLLWVVSPGISSMTNLLGVNDAISGVFANLTTWGLPYLFGRLYVRDATALRHLALVLFCAGLVYLPFVLWEMRMSPRLHQQLYGFVTYEHGGRATYRLGGWRPIVFQQHGLMLGLLMASVAVIGGWMWVTKSWTRFSPAELIKGPQKTPTWRSWSGIARRTSTPSTAPKLSVPFWPLAIGMIGVAILCRALNAIGLMMIVLGVLLLLRNPLVVTRLGLVALLLVPPLYVANRISPALTGVRLEEPLIELAGKIDPERAESLIFRVDNEEILAEHALHRPVFGWGGWGRNRVFNEYGDDISVTDGLWIIILGRHGLFGLFTWYFAMAGALWLMVIRYPVRVLGSPEAAPAVALALIVMMFMIDCLPNAMVSVIFPLAVGGLSGVLIAHRPRSQRPPAVPVTRQPAHALAAGAGV